jgi:hypothetical protein
MILSAVEFSFFSSVASCGWPIYVSVVWVMVPSFASTKTTKNSASEIEGVTYIRTVDGIARG